MRLAVRMTLLLVLLAVALAVYFRVGRAGPGAQVSLPAPAPPPRLNLPGGEVELSGRLSGEREIALSWRWTGTGPAPQGSAVLYRSTAELVRTRLNDVRFPIVSTALESPWQNRDLIDASVADGVTYHYQLELRGGEERFSAVVAVEVPDRALPELGRPSVLVDKASYTLEVRDGGRTAKRYPIALGRNPRARKLHQDNASTPEGIYRVYNLQPEATFHRAWDLDYPNATDRVRYDLAAGAGLLPRTDFGEPGIGGEIQVHGRGIHANWTYGCVALRDEDMDELFAHPELAAGLEVVIVGESFTRRDLDAVASFADPARAAALQGRLAELGYDPGPADGALGDATRRALGRFQLDRGLPASCQPDAATTAALLP